jgi:cyclic pyranopterin phosphate synthase
MAEMTGGIRKVMSEQNQQGRDPLTHFNAQGRAFMVDVSDKPVTARTASAQAKVRMAPETLARIREGSVAKGDVLAVAQVAGIQAAKKTSDLIPMCHPIPLTGVDIRFADNGADVLTITAEVKTTGRTGAEMEALTAAASAALTVYDMCKAIQKDIIIEEVKLLTKTGGKSGDYRAV